VRRCQGGQAAIELLAMVPVLIVAGLLAWQLMSVIGAGLRVQAELRVMAATTVAGAVSDTVVVSTRVPVPVVLPGMGGLEVPARVGVRVP
jgi:hypothetical protein